MTKTLAPLLALSLYAAPLLAEHSTADFDARTFQSLGEGEAFVLVKMDARGDLKQYVSSLNFSANGNDYELKIPKEKGFQLVKVKAGTYQPETFGVRSRKASKSKHFDHNNLHDKAVVVEPGTVTYIGQWDIAYGKRFELLGRNFTTDQNGYRVSYSPAAVSSFADKNAWITEFPLRLSHISGQTVATTWQRISEAQYN